MENTSERINLSSLGPRENLPYSIHSSSGHTSAYVPSNILIDNPADQTSRWTGSISSTSASNSGSGSGAGTGNGEDEKKVNVISATGNGRTGTGAKRKEVQYVTIELERVSLVQWIGFGKYQKLHPCNLADFAVYGGLSPDIRFMELLYTGGLKNDHVKEKFELKLDEGKEGVLLPIKYLRIDAIAAHSQNYNVSIWHVWLEGFSSPSLMERVHSLYSEYRNTLTSHLILSHLRRQNLLLPFSSLLSSLSPAVQKSFENPLATALHKSLVLSGQFSSPGVEELLEDCLKEGLLDEWGKGKGKSVARWSRIGEEHEGPTGRGGHQMVKVGRKILLFGGWDGEKNLGDLWEFDLPMLGEDEGAEGGEWRMLESGEEEEGEEKRPRGRSCHQLAVDDSTGWVYLLGGMDPPPSPTSEGNENGNGTTGMDMETDEGKKNPLANDFWRYKAARGGRGVWELLSKDTSIEGGPKLLFDHQMVVHSADQILYVFGGKHVQLEKSEAAAQEEGVEGRFSGMFAYDIEKRKWQKLFGDPTPTDTFRSERLLSRIGHAMLFDTNRSTLYVFAGQRGETFLADLWAIRLRSSSPDSIKEEEDSEDDDSTREGKPPYLSTHWRAGAALESSASSPTFLDVSLLNTDYSTQGPPPGFTQRASIDVESGEWTMVTGSYVIDRKNREVARSDVWSRSKDGVWELVEPKGEVPPGRFAAQVVYDPLRKEHYVFGGNPQTEDRNDRLGDFWKLRIVKPSPEEALRRARFLVRKQRFTEMCQTAPTISALNYLQTTLSSVVDHTDEMEASAFRACMASLLSAPASNNYEEMDEGEDDASVASDHEGPMTMKLYEQRQKLFEELLDFFPEEERSPRDDLRDMAARREETQRARFY